MRWILLCLAMVTSARAEEKDPIQTIKDLVSVISTHVVADSQMKEASSHDKALFQEHRKTNQKAHDQIAEFIDFEKLGMDSMPKKWRDKYWVVKASEKKKFLELFSDFFFLALFCFKVFNIFLQFCLLKVGGSQIFLNFF